MHPSTKICTNAPPFRRCGELVEPDGANAPSPGFCGDRMRDYVFNTIGMIDADKNKLPKANVGRTR